MRTIFTGLAAAALLAATPALAQEPKPQFTVEDLQKDFAKPQDETTVGKTRGFSLAAPAASPAGPTAPKAAPRPAPGGKKVASVPRPTQAVAPTPPPSGRDLLITFANASATLTPQARANAKVFAQAANTSQLQSARFAIDGHTNAVGGRDYNLNLSRARAQALVDYLASLGVDRSRIDVNGYGFDRPINAANPRAAENRRVEARRVQ
jgi:outer membrane protein OmpA-like peptidoglycan-associated protein